MLRILLLVTALGFTGCGDSKPLSMAATPESSRAALVTALDAWKDGKTPKDLGAGSPPLLFVDDDINRPNLKLVSYKIEGEGQVRGTGYSYVVVLTLQDKESGKTREKRAAYTAVTEPKLAVTKEDRQP